MASEVVVRNSQCPHVSQEVAVCTPSTATKVLTGLDLQPLMWLENESWLWKAALVSPMDLSLGLLEVSSHESSS